MPVEHGVLKGYDVHKPYRWEFDNLDQLRKFKGVHPEDLNKIAVVKNTFELYRLKQVSPFIWWENVFEPYMSEDKFLKGKEIANVEYDSNGNKTRVDYVDGYYQLFQYDANGNLIDVKIYYSDALIEHWTYTYDAQNRLQSSTRVV